jgi:hypothetical protein
VLRVKIQLLAVLTIGWAVLVQTALAQSGAHGFIGVGMADAAGRAVVGQVQPGGPADKAGLQAGDVVVSLNGKPLTGAAAMSATIIAMTPGQTARLGIVRGTQSREIAVVIGASGGAPPPPAAAAQAARTLVAPPSGGSPAISVSNYTRLTDPLEQAFTVDVPSGWKSEAGMARWSALQIDPYVRSLSPDKMTYLMIGEPSLPSYAPPTDVTRKLGFREGSLHDAGLGGRSMILHYLTGAEFARMYGQSALSGLCPGLKFVSTGERPELARKAEAQWPTVIPSRSSGGEAVFTCTHNKQEMEAHIEAATRTTRDNVIWGVILLQGYIAPKSGTGAAQTILAHMTGNVTWSQAWTQKQNNLSQQAAASINQRMQEFFRQEQAFMQKLNSVDQNFESMDEIVSGFSSYRDARTGNTYSLGNTNPFKWADDSGRVVSTPTNVAPAWGAYRPLQHVQ